MQTNSGCEYITLSIILVLIAIIVSLFNGEYLLAFVLLILSNFIVGIVSFLMQRVEDIIKESLKEN
jgi:uncharacterized membrane protein